MTADIQCIHAVAPSQRGMLIEGASGTNSPGLFIEQSVLAVKGELDFDRFSSAVHNTANAHSSLRSCFAWDAERPVQVVLNKIRPVVECKDWRDKEATKVDQSLSTWLDEDRARGIALNRAPLWRFTVIRLQEDEYRVVWTHHHIITDGWSVAVVLSDLLHHYLHQQPLPPALPFRNYIDWIETQEKQLALEFWRKRILAHPPFIPMAPRADVNRFEETTGIDVSCLLEAARSRGVSFAVAAFATWALALRSALSSDDVVFGVTAHGRPATLVGVERIVGPFIATFPLHVKTKGMTTAADLLQQIEKLQREQQPYEYVSAGEANQAANVRTRLYDSLVVVEQTPQQVIPGNSEILVSAQEGIGARSHHPLLLRVSSDGLARLLYNQRFVSDQAVSALKALVHSAAKQISENAPLTPLGEGGILWANTRRMSLRPPETREEKVVLGLAQELFGPFAALEDNFFDLGGHSLMAVNFLEQIAVTTGVRLPISQLLHDARLGAIAKALTGNPENDASGSLKKDSFFIPGNPGSPLYASKLAANLKEWHLYGLEAPGLNGRKMPASTVEALAEHHLSNIAATKDPVVVLGHSFGGWVAFEMGLRLQAQGRVAIVILLDTPAPSQLSSRGDVSDEALKAEIALLQERAGRSGVTVHVSPGAFAVYAAARRAVYAPKATSRFHVALFKASAIHPDDGWERSDPAYGWDEVCCDIHVESVAGDHLSIMQEPHVVDLAQRIELWLNTVKTAFDLLES